MKIIKQPVDICSLMLTILILHSTYYIKNGFKPLYKTEQSEKDAFGIHEDEALKSRVMFFDLKTVTA